MGAQARQARRVQPAAARRRPTRASSCGTATCPLLPSVKYVITLDSDTQLPMDAARRLVGTLAHPLNRPRFDPGCGRVTEGYGVLQPRVGVSLESASRTSFAQVFSGHVGIDPYTTRGLGRLPGPLSRRAASSARASTTSMRSQAALAGRVPENTLLSHDLFEGFYARAGTRAPTSTWWTTIRRNYLAFAARQHRWVRGDWQIVRWLWRTVPDANGRPVPQHAAGRSRDGRFSTTCAGACCRPRWSRCFVAAGRSCRARRCCGRLLACSCSRFPPTCRSADRCRAASRGVPLREHVLAERDTLVTSAQAGAPLHRFLLHQSWVMLDAIGRTLVRLLVHDGGCSSGSPPIAHRDVETSRGRRAAAHVGSRLPSRGRHRRAGRRRRAGPASAGAARSRVCGALSPAHCLRHRARRPRTGMRRSRRDAAHGASTSSPAGLAVLRRARRPGGQLADPGQPAGKPARSESRTGRRRPISGCSSSRRSPRATSAT